MTKYTGDLSQRWERKRADAEDIRASGKAVIYPAHGRRFHVIAPLHDDFRAGALELAGTWRHRSGVWSFNIRSQRLVFELATRVYGAENVEVRA